MFQPAVVGERLAAGINWVDRQIGGGDFVAGQIWRLGKLLGSASPTKINTSSTCGDSRIGHLHERPAT